MSQNSKIIVHNTSQRRWERLLLYYQWFFTVVFLAFGLVLLADRTVFLGIMFCLLGVQLCPVKQWKQLRNRLPKTVSSLLWLLNLAGVYAGFMQLIR